MLHFEIENLRVSKDAAIDAKYAFAHTIINQEGQARAAQWGGRSECRHALSPACSAS